MDKNIKKQPLYYRVTPDLIKGKSKDSVISKKDKSKLQTAGSESESSKRYIKENTDW